MKTAVIYCRYSSDSQTEQSIDGQLRVCTEYAKNNDILILDTYIDRNPFFTCTVFYHTLKVWTVVISTRCGTAKNGKTKRYYKCLGRKHNNGCNKQAIRKDVLENIVLENIISELSKPQVMNMLVNGLLAEQQRQAQCNTALNLLLKE